MLWSAERRATHLLQMKRLQVRLRSLACTAATTQAQQLHAEAESLRTSARTTVQASIPLPEQGLGRAALFERLRLLAVARAHALELTQRASELDQQARAHDATAQDHRRAAGLSQRKANKLEHWQQRQRRLQQRRRDHRHHLELLEEAACRRRSS